MDHLSNKERDKLKNVVPKPRFLIRPLLKQEQTSFTAVSEVAGNFPFLRCQKQDAVNQFIPLNIELLYDNANSSVIFLVETLDCWKCCRLSSVFR